MRKLTLDPEAIEVQSFCTGRTGRRGTVQAHEDTMVFPYEDGSVDGNCAGYEASFRCATGEGDSCSPCSNPGAGQCVNLSVAGPTWCPKSACV